MRTTGEFRRTAGGSADRVRLRLHSTQEGREHQVGQMNAEVRSGPTVQRGGGELVLPEANVAVARAADPQNHTIRLSD